MTTAELHRSVRAAHRRETAGPPFLRREWVARRGWLEPKDVINTRPLEELWKLRQRH